jgi:hypothetical protein
VSERSSERPRLCLVVDTEEEFDWSAPFSRANVDVSAIAEIDRLQAVVRPYGITPTYVIDYPVASTAASADQLAQLARLGECHIGAHLHPWVNPPYVETVNGQMSYGCNLGFDLERAKIAALQAAIAERVGVRPRSYKAGRYGFGRSSAHILEELGFDVDLSVIPQFDFGSDGGPSFEGFAPTPAIFGEHRRLLEIPLSSGFVGVARRVGARLRRAASSPWLERFHAVGILARCGLANRIVLSPEGNTLHEMQSLTKTLLAEGVRTFSLTLHSPSLKPGCTPYVRTEHDRDRMLDAIDRYCDYFMNQIAGVATTPIDMFCQMEGRAA